MFNKKSFRNSPVALVLAAAVLTMGAYTLGSTSSSSGNTANVWTSITSMLTGSGAPSGAHYELQIIGMSKDKTADMTGDNGHRIFVDLGTKDGAAVRTNIMLQQSTDGTFGVLDANGTDGTASFKLPAPGSYAIYARAVGTPGGTSKITTCATDPVTLQQVCSTTNQVFIRTAGGSKFKDVTVPLTTINLDASLTTIISACGATTVSLFDPCLEGYLWAYDNNGLKNLQVRFYQL
jgi:hypothetical protein